MIDPTIRIPDTPKPKIRTRKTPIVPDGFQLEDLPYTKEWTEIV